MNKITPYTAFCDIFRCKEKSNHEDCRENNTENVTKYDNVASLQNCIFKKVPQVDNSCQTQPLRDYAMDKIMKAARNKYSEAQLTHSSIIRDDNFQILHPDYAAYSGENFPNRNRFKTIAERPCTAHGDRKESNNKKHRTLMTNLKQQDVFQKTASYNPYKNTMYETHFSTTHYPKLKYKTKHASVKGTRQFHPGFKNVEVNALYKTVSHLKTAFADKYNHAHDEKCLCDHCGVLSVINDSLKHPMICDQCEEEQEEEQHHRKKHRKHHSRKDKYDEKEYAKLLTKLKKMQERLEDLETLNYVEGPFKQKNTTDTYTQCDKKKTRFAEPESRQNSPRKYQNSCPFSFIFPHNLKENIKEKIFRRKSPEPNNSIRSEDSSSSDSDDWVQKTKQPEKHEKFPKPKLRCHTYMGLQKDQPKKSSLKSSLKPCNVPTKKDTEKNAITERDMQDLLFEISNIRSRSPTSTLEADKVRFYLKSKQTGVLYQRNIGGFSSESCVQSDMKFMMEQSKNIDSKNIITELTDSSNQTCYNHHKNPTDCILLKEPYIIEKLVQTVPEKNLDKFKQEKPKTSTNKKTKSSVRHPTNNIFLSNDTYIPSRKYSTMGTQHNNFFNVMHSMKTVHTDFYGDTARDKTTFKSSAKETFPNEVGTLVENITVSTRKNTTNEPSFSHYSNYADKFSTDDSVYSNVIFKTSPAYNSSRSSSPSNNKHTCNATINDKTRKKKSNVTINDKIRKKKSNVTINDKTRKKKSNVTINDKTRKKKSNVTINDKTRKKKSNVTINDKKVKFVNQNRESQSNQKVKNFVEINKTIGHCNKLKSPKRSPQRRNEDSKNNNNDMSVNYFFNKNPKDKSKEKELSKKKKWNFSFLDIKTDSVKKAKIEKANKKQIIKKLSKLSTSSSSETDSTVSICLEDMEEDSITTQETNDLIPNKMPGEKGSIFRLIKRYSNKLLLKRKPNPPVAKKIPRLTKLKTKLKPADKNVHKDNKKTEKDKTKYFGKNKSKIPVYIYSSKSKKTTKSPRRPVTFFLDNEDTKDPMDVLLKQEQNSSNKATNTKKSTKKLNKYSLIKPVMKDKDTVLSNETIFTQLSSKIYAEYEEINIAEEKEKDTESMNTLLVNSIESIMQGQHNMPMNNIIIFNSSQTNCDTVPIMCTQSTNNKLNNLTIETNILNTLMPKEDIICSTEKTRHLTEINKYGEVQNTQKKINTVCENVTSYSIEPNDFKDIETSEPLENTQNIKKKINPLCEKVASYSIEPNDQNYDVNEANSPTNFEEIKTSGSLQNTQNIKKKTNTVYEQMSLYSIKQTKNSTNINYGTNKKKINPICEKVTSYSTEPNENSTNLNYSINTARRLTNFEEIETSASLQNIKKEINLACEKVSFYSIKPNEHSTNINYDINEARNSTNFEEINTSGSLQNTQNIQKKTFPVCETVTSNSIEPNKNRTNLNYSINEARPSTNFEEIETSESLQNIKKEINPVSEKVSFYSIIPNIHSTNLNYDINAARSSTNFEEIKTSTSLQNIQKIMNPVCKKVTSYFNQPNVNSTNLNYNINKARHLTNFEEIETSGSLQNITKKIIPVSEKVSFYSIKPNVHSNNINNDINEARSSTNLEEIKTSGSIQNTQNIQKKINLVCEKVTSYFIEPKVNSTNLNCSINKAKHLTNFEEIETSGSSQNISKKIIPVSEKVSFYSINPNVHSTNINNDINEAKSSINLEEIKSSGSLQNTQNMNKKINPICEKVTSYSTEPNENSTNLNYSINKARRLTNFEEIETSGSLQNIKKEINLVCEKVSFCSIKPNEHSSNINYDINEARNSTNFEEINTSGSLQNTQNIQKKIFPMCEKVTSNSIESNKNRTNLNYSINEARISTNFEEIETSGSLQNIKKEINLVCEKVSFCSIKPNVHSTNINYINEARNSTNFEEINTSGSLQNTQNIQKKNFPVCEKVTSNYIEPNKNRTNLNYSINEARTSTNIEEIKTFGSFQNTQNTKSINTVCKNVTSYPKDNYATFLYGINGANDFNNFKKLKKSRSFEHTQNIKKKTSEVCNKVPSYFIALKDISTDLLYGVNDVISSTNFEEIQKSESLHNTRDIKNEINPICDNVASYSIEPNEKNIDFHYDISEVSKSTDLKEIQKSGSLLNTQNITKNLATLYLVEPNKNISQMYKSSAEPKNKNSIEINFLTRKEKPIKKKVSISSDLPSRNSSTEINKNKKIKQEKKKIQEEKYSKNKNKRIIYESEGVVRKKNKESLKEPSIVSKKGGKTKGDKKMDKKDSVQSISSSLCSCKSLPHVPGANSNIRKTLYSQVVGCKSNCKKCIELSKKSSKNKIHDKCKPSPSKDSITAPPVKLMYGPGEKPRKRKPKKGKLCNTCAQKINCTEQNCKPNCPIVKEGDKCKLKPTPSQCSCSPVEIIYGIGENPKKRKLKQRPSKCNLECTKSSLLMPQIPKGKKKKNCKDSPCSSKCKLTISIESTSNYSCTSSNHSLSSLSSQKQSKQSKVLRKNCGSPKCPQQKKKAPGAAEASPSSSKMSTIQSNSSAGCSKNCSIKKMSTLQKMKNKIASTFHCDFLKSLHKRPTASLAFKNSTSNICKDCLDELDNLQNASRNTSSTLMCTMSGKNRSSIIDAYNMQCFRLDSTDDTSRSNTDGDSIKTIEEKLYLLQNFFFRMQYEGCTSDNEPLENP